MTATKQDIIDWLERAKTMKATHLVVVCDSWDWENYPIYVLAGEDVNKVINDHQGKNMEHIDEVYNLSKDTDLQLAQYRSWNL